MPRYFEVKHNEAFRRLVGREFRDNRYKKFRDETERNVVIGYTAEYAIYVHEDMDKFHPTGEAKWLENAMTNRAIQKGAKEVFREEFDVEDRDVAGFSRASLLECLIAAAEYVLEQANENCPFDTGYLVSTGAVWIEGEEPTVTVG